jgi:hypothetical protein
MQTLNVGAGRTDTEYQEAEKQRRADLLADSRSDANYFFWAAGLAALGTGLLPVRFIILVSIGLVDLLRVYGQPMGPHYSLIVYGAALMWVVMVLLGIAGRSGRRWAFVAGMIIYGADMIALIVMFSLWAFGLHAFFVFRWYQAQKALQRSQRSERLGPLRKMRCPLSLKRRMPATIRPETFTPYPGNLPNPRLYVYSLT